MGSRSRFALVVLAALVAVLVIAVPAMASSYLKKGGSQLLTPSSMVTSLQGKHVSINAIAPVVYKSRVQKNLSWWFKDPIYAKAFKNGGATVRTSYDPKTGKGVFYHEGSLVWVEASGATHLKWKWQGLRVVALNKTSYQLVVTAGNQKPYIANDIVAVSNHSTKITHSGKNYHIDGVQFKLTTAGATQLQTALGETDLSTSLILFDSDIYFTLK